MTDAARKLMTVAEFLEWDDGTDTRYELLFGQPVAMAPPLEARGTIVINIGAALRPRLKSPCRVVGEAGIFRPDKTDRYYQADAAVTCQPPRPGGRPVPDPIVVFEVLSPSTSGRDLHVKLPDYQEISSIQEVVVVFTDARRVEHWRRDGDKWVGLVVVGEGQLELRSIGTSLSLAEIYADVSLLPREDLSRPFSA